MWLPLLQVNVLADLKIFSIRSYCILFLTNRVNLHLSFLIVVSRDGCEYDTHISLSMVTCANKFEISSYNNLTGITLEECKAHCDQESDCKFFFRQDTYNFCISYSACDQTRGTTHIGSTYSKENCTGNM